MPGSAGGLSPHGRGNPSSSVLIIFNVGSIPARAGEPVASSRMRTGSGVYPRTGGGTNEFRSATSCEMGLSPHGRGNHVLDSHAEHPHGSIPARAGEPTASPSPRSGRRVYPRTGGGTGRVPPAFSYGEGLSPHGRGNPLGAYRRSIRRGSIPARAGEPRPRSRRARSVRVYPRTGGGTGTRIEATVCG